MPIAEWENLFSLESPIGTLVLNDQDNSRGFGFYVTVKEEAESGTDVRATGDPVPQGFGTIWHRGFANGYVVKMPIQYWVNKDLVASECTSPTAQEMEDNLMRHYRALMNGGGRLTYLPQGLPDRILDSLYAIAKPTLTETNVGTATVLTFGSEFPYLIDFTQITTSIDSGTPTATLTNNGSAPFYPVFKVYGPFDGFTLSNNTTGLEIVYDDSLPGAVAVGGGDYIEISTFRNTVYLNGSGASRKAGIDILDSDFFALEVGDNEIETGGTDTPAVDILWQAAWF